MSTATCEERITQPDSPKRSRPPGVAPLFRLSGVARRLQTAAGHAHSSRLGKTKNRQQRGTAGYFSRLLSSDPIQKTKWPSRGTATLLPSVARTGTLCWKFVSKAFLRQKAAKVPKKAAKRKKRASEQRRLSVVSHRFLRLSAISALECARRPCAATTTREEMESAKARRRRGRRGGESSLDLCSHRKVR